ncbi:hypothetical protein Y032_0426g1254 [Ancylostoma ceylanicum]|uniref:Uncharacterized protein n=1 Tax=Ancylostoma ceylanicum TaxID=53326 RepID=A0A016X0N7_9BILA|nr:hypothetical protein Y032_0426g1254 [Ancylostoma ceylanicum]
MFFRRSRQKGALLFSLWTKHVGLLRAFWVSGPFCAGIELQLIANTQRELQCSCCASAGFSVSLVPPTWYRKWMGSLIAFYLTANGFQSENFHTSGRWIVTFDAFLLWQSFPCKLGRL